MKNDKCPFCGAESVCYDSRIIHYECLSTNSRISHLDTQSETCKQVCQLQKEHRELEERYKRLVEAVDKFCLNYNIKSGGCPLSEIQPMVDELERKAVEG